ncbi:hypothetical protein [Streptomyces tailanensis]|uniref:hypothetical protein n=1 Tax=Streptomyces tailanensis TaxID=2569858 RepID=UPI00122E55AE|nr:hypothetical protein [Streptomyces tailanensis]
MKAKTRLLAVVPLAMTMVVGVNAAEANAVTKHWSSKPYGGGFSTWSAPLDRCVTVNISGTMEYRWWRKQPTTNRKDMWIDQVRLKKPQMEMIVKGNCRANGAPRKLTAAKMSQVIYDHGCKTSTAITVSYPFAVGVTPTKKCGRIKVAKRKSSFSNDNSKYYQFNTGRPATFKPDGMDAAPYKGRKSICLRADVTATAVIKNYDDSFSKTMSICAKVFN